LQWGRPGPGGVYWRDSAVTGQKFFDKMVSIVRFQVILLVNSKSFVILHLNENFGLSVIF